MHYIERCTYKGNKQRLVPIKRTGPKGAKLLPLRYRHRQSLADMRRDCAREYLLESGRAMLWPPLNRESIFI